uniref:C2H2-type domain-containing protein n=1 Tax=Globisporangium ultimum (strain ATCC 200006 / CBS 805.95 / DAOM BR144) TaxID=431595 RepID=K3WIE7_GLOUD
MWTCTACRLEFASFDEQKEHFRSDWHRYNLKRKVVELPPVSEEQFDFRMQKVLQDKQKALENDPKHKQMQKREEMKKSGVKTMTKCVACNKTFTTSNAYDNHLTSKKHLANIKKNPTVADVTETIQKKLDIVSLDGSTEDEDSSDSNNPATTMTDEEVAVSLEEYKKQIPLTKEDCIFCAHKAADFDANLSHMLKEHGFFIPDVEFLVDAEGLVDYLAEKVKLGNFCLYCNGKGKTFRNYQDVQKHMTALSHCKLPYNDDDDLEELLDFYDFSSQYKSKKKALTAPKEDDEAEGENVEWETDSEASVDDDEEVVEETEDAEESDDESDDDEALHTINVSETGELVLASGKRLGRREFRRYYRQRFRAEEARESVLAVTKERLLLAYQTAGVDPAAGSTALSTAFVANLLAKRNNISSGMSIAESRRKNFLFAKHRERLDTRSHKFQKNPNRRKLVCV